MGELNWLEPVGTFVGTYGLAVFLVVYYVIQMYPQVRKERKEWIAEIVRLEQLVNPETRPVTRSQAEVVGDIAIDAYLNKLSILTTRRDWRSGLTCPPGWTEPPEDYVSHGFLGQEFAYDPKSDDPEELRKIVRKFSELREKVNSDRRTQLFEVLRQADESAEKIQYQLARLRFQDDSLSTPWKMALTAVQKTWKVKQKDLDFLASFYRHEFLEFIQKHPAYEQVKNEQDTIVAVAEIPFGVEELLDLTRNIMKSALYKAMGST